MLKALDKRILFGGLAAVSVIIYIYILVLIVPFSIYSLIGIMLLALGIILAFTNVKPFFLLVFFVLPLSVEVPLGLGDSKIFLPSEAITITLGIAFLITILFIKSPPKSFVFHPVSIFVLLYILVLIVTTATSQMPVVSVKFTLINLLYIMVFYFLANAMIKKFENKGLSLYYLYGLAALLVISFTIYTHSTYGFKKNAASIVAMPFYSDHAIYSACLAMLLPAFIGFSFKGKIFGLKQWTRIFALLICLAIITGIFFSYTRATWVSIVVSALFYFFLTFKLKPAHVFAFIILGAVIFLNQKDEILNSWKLNRANSTAYNATLADQTKSITNISNDLSNAERLNRWSCAWRMFLDKPITGFGPGTYQFQYLNYQRQNEMTRISVTSAYNNPHGKGGSAHSEYLLALSESGIFGLFSLLGVVLLSVYHGMRAYHKADTEKEKLSIAIVLTAMMTYFIHVFFNNYLNIDKAASLFWLSLSILVTICSGQNHKQVKGAVA